MEGLSRRLQAAADALTVSSDVETGWLRGAAILLERGEEARRSARTSALWLEALAPAARARKTSLHRAWVDAASALRAAVHLLDSERGPLAEALFPEWKAPALRRHVDQTLAAEVELQRRLSSSYVVRRLTETATERALRPALETLALAQTSWSAERDRPALAGEEAEEVLARLHSVAEETARTLERVRLVVRASLADRPDLAEAVFPARVRPSAAPSDGRIDVPAGIPADAEGGRTVSSTPAPGAANEAEPSSVASNDQAGAQVTGVGLAPDGAISVAPPRPGRLPRVRKHVASGRAAATSAVPPKSGASARDPGQPSADGRGRATPVRRGASERPRPAPPRRRQKGSTSVRSETAPAEAVVPAPSETSRQRGRPARSAVSKVPLPERSPPATARPRTARTPRARRS